MGSLPRLQKKDELHYRIGSTNEARNCKHCINLVEKFEVTGISGAGSKSWEPRCKVMGLQMSRRYRVRLDYTCDAQTLNEKSCWWLQQGASNA